MTLFPEFPIKEHSNLNLFKSRARREKEGWKDGERKREEGGEREERRDISIFCFFSRYVNIFTKIKLVICFRCHAPCFTKSVSINLSAAV